MHLSLSSVSGVPRGILENVVREFVYAVSLVVVQQTRRAFGARCLSDVYLCARCGFFLYSVPVHSVSGEPWRDPSIIVFLCVQSVVCHVA